MSNKTTKKKSKQEKTLKKKSGAKDTRDSKHKFGQAVLDHKAAQNSPEFKKWLKSRKNMKETKGRK